MAESIAHSVLRALGFALFARDHAGALRLVIATDWLAKIWPAVTVEGALLEASASPFLENFLIDAGECWQASGDGRVNSGPFVEQDAEGNSVELEATALSVAGQPALLLERLGEAFAAKKAVLQKARENVIAQQRLHSETQKKEILLHYLAEEMSAALANAVTALRLLELEPAAPRSKMLLGLAMRATDEQRALLHRVLAIFADELGGLSSVDGGAEGAADLSAILRAALEGASELAQEKRVRLTSDRTEENTVLSISPGHLERALANLLENAIERSSAGGEVKVSVESVSDAAVIYFADKGALISRDACENLFSSHVMAENSSNPKALRLHFCRLIAESSGGEIGCDSSGEGANRFWIRLPKISR